MTYTRLTGALSTLALTLVLGACSTTDDLAAPMLEPQYGTAANDVPVDVVTGPAGAVYNLYNYVGSGGCVYYDDGYSDCYDHEEVAVLARYDATGNVVWERNVFDQFCYDYYCDIYRAEAVYVDANNYTYVLVSDYYPNEPDGIGPSVNFTVHKYAPQGEEVGSYYLGYFDESRSNIAFELTVDAKGDIYVVARGKNYENGYNYIAKYTNTGSLVWRRTSNTTPAYGTPTDITVSSSGSIYVVGTKGFSRYSSTGNLTWSKTGIFEEVTLSGSNLYARYRTALYKYSSSGSQLWKKTQSGLSGLFLQGMTGDGSGNVYLAGKYSATTTDRNAFTRKLNASGSVLWTKTFGTSAYDDARAIATISGSEIYTTGVTRGALSHSNVGGEDGYLRKTNSSGNRVWTR